MQADAVCPRGQRGFTLIELIVVMTIIAIVATGAALAMGLGDRSSPLQQHARQLERSIDYLQHRALIGSQSLALIEHQGRFEVLQRFQNRWVALASVREHLPDAGLYQHRLRGVELDLPGYDEPVPAWLFFPNGESSGGQLRVQTANESGIGFSLSQTGAVSLHELDDE